MSYIVERDSWSLDLQLRSATLPGILNGQPLGEGPALAVPWASGIRTGIVRAFRVASSSEEEDRSNVVHERLFAGVCSSLRGSLAHWIMCEGVPVKGCEDALEAGLLALD
jgi:hypothetical protein